jgi:hypothetical protein
MDLLVELTGSGMTNEQKAKLKAETAMIKARTKEMQNQEVTTANIDDQTRNEVNSLVESINDYEADENESD